MSVINTATKLYVGSNLAAKAYSGTNQVWPARQRVEIPRRRRGSMLLLRRAAPYPERQHPAGKKLVNDLIVGLKTDGVWTKLDRLWIFAAENAKSSIIDMVGLASSTPTGHDAEPNNGYFCNNDSVCCNDL